MQDHLLPSPFIMAKYRPIKTQFWTDDWVSSLSAQEKLLYLYLITNPATTLCGIYRVSVRYLVFETGLTQKEVESCLKRFRADGKVAHADGWIIIKNFEKHQTKSPKILEGIKRELAEIPQHIAEMRYCIDRVSIGTDKPVLEPELVLKPNLTSISKEIGETPKTFGNEEINKTLEAIRLKVGIDDFSDAQKWKRIYGQHCLNLLKKIGSQEFSRRLDIILNDSFKHKRCNQIKYIYEEVKGFIEPINNSIKSF